MSDRLASMTVGELRELLKELPDDALIAVRHDYRNAPVTGGVVDPSLPGLVLSVDWASVETRFEQVR